MTGETVPLDTIFLHVTKACNLSCTYCYFSARHPLPDELTASEFASIWPGIVSVTPTKVVFTGGEPLLRPDILDLITGLRDADPDHRIVRCLNTNGHTITSDVAVHLASLVDEVRVSVDALRDRNDDLRGEGNFVNAMRSIDVLRGVGLEPKILVTVTRHSVPDLERLLCLLMSQGLTRINVVRFRPVGRGSGRLGWCVSEEEVAAVIGRAWRRLHPRHVPPAERPQIASQHTCGVGRFLNIMPDGDVFPCHVLTEPEFRCGSLRKDDLRSICSRHGLLGRLSALDFDRLTQGDPQLSAVTVKGACMGEVYARHRESPAWNAVLGVPSSPGVLPEPEG